MSNIPQNPYSNTPVAPLLNANHGLQMFNHNVQTSQIPGSQLPPSYGMKPDSNSNSPAHASTSPPNNIVGHVQKASSYNQSGSSSPAFSNQGMMPPTQSGVQPSPIGPPMKVGPTSMASHNLPPQNIPMSSPSPGNLSNANSSPIPHFPRFPNQQQRQINDNAPPLIPSSQYNQPLMNGPPGSFPPNQYPVSTSGVSGSINAPFGQPQVTQASTVMRPPVSATNPQNLHMPRQPNNPPANSVSFPGPQFNSLGPQSGPAMGPPRTGLNGPLSSGPSYSGPAMPSRNLYSASPSGPPSGQFPLPVSGTAMGPPVSQNQSFVDPYKNGYSGPLMKHPPNINNYNVPQSLPSGQRPPMGPQMGPVGINRPPGLPSGPIGPVSGPPGLPSGPTGLASGPIGPPGPLNGPPGPLSGPTSLPPGPPSGHPQPPSAPLNRPPIPSSGYAPPSGHAGGQPVNSMQNRYPQMSQASYNQPNIPPQPQPNVNRQYGYNAQGITQQMGQLSVTHQGFDQLWGHQMFDLMQCRQIHPEYPEDPPEIRLGHQFADSPNCSPEIFRCTINRIPETNSLLQRSRLPLGILIHPFKDLNHLPVIQCTTIVRCRACRTYINPFVYFVDNKRWKCNLCYRVNDLPEEFQYDPVSKSYGDPSRRPEIKSATIEFIAPSEYMLRPPQPAVYLFLMDVSQIARESGYLQVLCECLKSNLDQLPGDARTQVGFICYDSHVHYYLMSDGLTRPKEMTVLDIDDVFLPSPESLLVNLGERRELVRELLSSLPQRHSTPGVPASALGAALQAAYKLMSPTGGRITVFQTCLPNIGPGALQSREDPNARSSKDVAHLNPATDFYKRLALDCSGAQVAVDLFLLNSQYCDLATLSGMSKFSAGSVYHIPLFNAARGWQADKLRRMLGRYLTRKIGFEAVMRVRATRGISIHTFHGNFFVRSTDLLSLPNVSPDAGFGMQLTIDEALSDLQQVCFQAALLYTSSKGERRIRVHTLALPIASSLTDVLHSADQQCIIGLLSKMGVDRAVSASLGEAREALLTVAVDILAAHRLAQNLPAGPASASLHAPSVLRLLPLYLHALLKRKAFRTGTSTRLDDRVADMGDMKCLPLAQLMRAVYPDLYPVHALHEYVSPPCDHGHDHDKDHEHDHDHDPVPDPPRMHLTAERINMDGAYLLDEGETMVLYVCSGVSQEFLSQALGVSAHAQLPDEARSLPALDTPVSRRLRAFIDRLNDDRPYAAELLLIKDTSPTRVLFTERLLDDRVESAFSYYEFLQHVKAQVK